MNDDKSLKISSSFNPSIIVFYVSSGISENDGFYQTAKSFEKIYNLSKKKFNILFLYPKNMNELLNDINKKKPSIIFFNGNRTTLSWLNLNKIKKKNITTVESFGSEINQKKALYYDGSSFDYLLTDDPTINISNQRVFKIGRFIQKKIRNYYKSNKTIIGSFGFPDKSKNFEKVIDLAKKNFKEFNVRYHIPKSSYMDLDGKIYNEISQKIKKKTSNFIITRDLLSKKDLVKKLSENDINCFLYTSERGDGSQVSGILEYAIAANRPLSLSNSTMFRHFFYHYPNKVIKSKNLNQIQNNGVEYFKRFYEEWSDENFIWDFNRIIEKIITKPVIKYHEWYIKNKTRRLKDLYKYYLKKNEVEFDHEVELNKIYNENYDLYVPNINKNYELNVFLNSEDINLFKDELVAYKKTVPTIIKEKFYPGLIQHCYMMRAVLFHINKIKNPNILCIGSYMDPLAIYLRRLGYWVDDCDPNLNYDFDELLHKPSIVKKKYDLIFSISVLEHVNDDLNLIRLSYKKLKRKGLSIHTVDFKENPELIPNTHIRFYNYNSALKIKEKYKLPEIKNSPKYDVYYNNTNYSFWGFGLIK